VKLGELEKVNSAENKDIRRQWATRPKPIFDTGYFRHFLPKIELRFFLKGESADLNHVEYQNVKESIY
jgi:hypothetical protein